MPAPEQIPDVAAGKPSSPLRPRGATAMRVAMLGIIVAVALIRAAWTWPVFAATADEPQHIAAGVEWLARSDRVQHEPWRTVNPPLARVAVGVGPYLAGLRTTPVLVDLLYAGPGYARNLALARAGVLPFLALVIVLTWLLARRAYGEAAAWIAALAVASIPAVIGHAGLATTDVAYTACFLLALLLLSRWIEQPDPRRAATAGLALGVAAATKFSAVSLPVIALLAIAARRALGPRPGTGRRLTAQAPLVGVVTLLVLWASYRFAIAAPASLWQPAWLDDTVNACFPSQAGRHAAHWLAAHRMPAPTAFLAALGLCAQEAPGRSTAFLLGQLSQDGFPAFFPIALAVKTPLPVIALALIGFVVVVRGRGPADDRFRALVPVIAALAVVALVMPTRTNIGVRHVLPVFPLIAVLAAAGAVALWRAGRGRTPARIAAVALLLWTLTTPLAAAPDYFAWFNALAGRHPERVLVDSDLDWGQDLLRLQQELAARRADRVSIAYFGASDVCRHALPPLRWLRPYERATGWVAVSEMYRSGVAGVSYRDGDPCDRAQAVDVFRPDANQYAWLNAYTPVTRIGKSIRLYWIP